MIRILLGVRHDLGVESLQALLQQQEDFQIVGTTTDGKEAVNQAKKLKPDVAVLDVFMQGLSGVEATRRIRQLLPKTQGIVMAAVAEDTHISQAMAAGAASYMLKDAAPAELAAAVRGVVEHGVHLSPRASRRLIDGYVRALRGKEAPPALTPKQREVLRLMTEGVDDDRIAHDLGVSSSTIRVHRRDMMQRLGVRSREALLEYGETLNS